MSDAIETAIDVALVRLKPWTGPRSGDLIAINALRAVSIAINAAEAIIRADERAKVSEEIREAANREDFEGTSWQAGMAYAHRIALGHATKPAETAVGAPTAHAAHGRNQTPETAKEA